MRGISGLAENRLASPEGLLTTTGMQKKTDVQHKCLLQQRVFRPRWL